MPRIVLLLLEGPFRFDKRLFHFEQAAKTVVPISVLAYICIERRVALWAHMRGRSAVFVSNPVRVQALPRLIWEMGAARPGVSQLALQLLLDAARSAVPGSTLSMALQVITVGTLMCDISVVRHLTCNATSYP
jgi:hypothetical protein